MIKLTQQLLFPHTPLRLFTVFIGAFASLQPFFGRVQHLPGIYQFGHQKPPPKQFGTLGLKGSASSCKPSMPETFITPPGPTSESLARHVSLNCSNSWDEYVLPMYKICRVKNSNVSINRQYRVSFSSSKKVMQHMTSNEFAVVPLDPETDSTLGLTQLSGPISISPFTFCILFGTQRPVHSRYKPARFQRERPTSAPWMCDRQRSRSIRVIFF